MSNEPWMAKWAVVEQLGEGGQGTTCLVSSTSGEPKNAVLKTLKKQDSLAARQRMHRESTNLATLKSAGIKVPGVLDTNTDRFEDLSIPLYFVMEHVAGPSLKQYVLQQALPLDRAAVFLKDLCSTVVAAHRSDVIHRDLKPDNIIVRCGTTPDLVIVDYGLSFNQQDERGTVTLDDEQFKSRFLSLPETNTFGEDQRDKRSDVTSLCALLYFLLTGNYIGQLHDGQGRPPHRRPNKHVAGLGERQTRQLNLFFDRAFSQSLENRFQTCEEVIERLEAIVQRGEQQRECPIEVAKEIADRLKVGNRRTQLAQYQQAAEKALTAITNAIQKRSGKMPNIFSVQCRRERSVDASKVRLSDIDIFNRGMEVDVTLHPQDFCITTHFGTGSRGNQCVVIRRQVKYSSKRKERPTAQSEWEPWFWFDPTTDFGSDWEPLLDDILVKAVRDLEEMTHTAT